MHTVGDEHDLTAKNLVISKSMRLAVRQPPALGGIQILGTTCGRRPKNRARCAAKLRASACTRSSCLAVQSRNFGAQMVLSSCSRIWRNVAHFRILIASVVPLSRAASLLLTENKMLKELRTDSLASYFQRHPTPECVGTATENVEVEIHLDGATLAALVRLARTLTTWFAFFTASLAM